MSKKPNKRSKAKYPSLEKKLNLKSRQDFIEIDYLDGITPIDSNDTPLISRPLNEDELTFLNQFYEESISTNFLHDPKLKQLNDLKGEMINCSEVNDLTIRLNELKDQLTGYVEPKEDPLAAPIRDSISKLKLKRKELKKRNQNQYYTEIKALEAEIQKVREEVLLISNPKDIAQCYSANNSRNRDIYNTKKAMGFLINLDPQKHDAYYSSKLDHSGLDYEEYLVHTLEQALTEEEEMGLLVKMTGEFMELGLSDDDILLKLSPILFDKEFKSVKELREKYKSADQILANLKENM